MVLIAWKIHLHVGHVLLDENICFKKKNKLKSSPQNQFVARPEVWQLSSTVFKYINFKGVLFAS